MSQGGSMIADKIVGLLGSIKSILLLLVIFLVTCVLTNFMSNTATTALYDSDRCFSCKQHTGTDRGPFADYAVIAGSCAYATPIGMPANTMVVGLGGYKFRDYVKIRPASDPRILCNLHDTAAHPVSFYP